MSTGIKGLTFVSLEVEFKFFKVQDLYMYSYITMDYRERVGGPMSLQRLYNRQTKSTYIFINISTYIFINISKQTVKAKRSTQISMAAALAIPPQAVWYLWLAPSWTKQGRSEELQELYENASGDVWWNTPVDPAPDCKTAYLGSVGIGIVCILSLFLSHIECMCT